MYINFGALVNGSVIRLLHDDAINATFSVKPDDRSLWFLMQGFTRRKS